MWARWADVSVDKMCQQEFSSLVQNLEDVDKEEGLEDMEV